MEDINQKLSSLSFASTLSSQNVSATTNPEIVPNPDNLSLSKLSNNLEKLLLDSKYDYSDSEIIVEGIPVGVNRCILAARSDFFHELFSKGNQGSGHEGKPKYLMYELVPYGKVGYEAFMVFLNYLYTGKLKPSPVEVSTCVDDDCIHDACRPAINYALELMYASATFQIKELVLLFQRRLLEFVEKALVEDVIPILLAAFHFQLHQLLSHCIQKIVRSDLDSVILQKELPYGVIKEIESLRSKSQEETSSDVVDPRNEKKIGQILKALDSDDVELVKLLINESNISLDNAHALHYAAAYCDPKIFKEVLGLNMANFNLKNRRGYTVLHVAARRKEPSMLVALLNKGACPFETTYDGKTAVAICRRLTRPKDYNENTKQGEKSNRDRICIDVLEREMKTSLMSGNIATSEMIDEDLHMKLLYLENRVAFARVLFPTEANLAMEAADVHLTSVYTGLAVVVPEGSSRNLEKVDWSETPSGKAKRESRVQALLKTVELGRRYFPHCSEVLDRILDEDLTDPMFLEKGSPEERKKKKRRFMELKDDLQKAFDMDMENNSRSCLPSSSSSSSSPKKSLKCKIGIK